MLTPEQVELIDKNAREICLKLVELDSAKADLQDYFYLLADIQNAAENIDTIANSVLNKLAPKVFKESQNVYEN